MADTIRGLTDEQLADYEQRAEQAMLTALESVMATIAKHLGATHTASALVAHLPGKHDQRTHGRGGGGSAPTPAGSFDSRLARAATDEQALSAASISISAQDPRGSLSSDQLIAVGAYRGSEFAEIAPALGRGGRLPAGIKQRVDAIDGAVGRSKLRRDVVVYRGIRSPRRLFGDRWRDGGGMEGATWTDRGYASTSVARGVATHFAQRSGRASEPVVMRMLVPRGSHGLQLSDRAKAPGGRGEGELLLGRGLRYRVAQDHGVVDGVRQLDVEVLG